MNSASPDKQDPSVIADPWSALRAFTNARIALGRVGASLPLRESLQFRLAHAHARDAVYSILDLGTLRAGIEGLGHTTEHVQSQATTREVYLKRPDLGRTLHENSRQAIEALSQTVSPSIAIVLADGLSATAINHHALPVLTLLLKRFAAKTLTVAPIVLASQSRVALADEIGALFRTRLSIILIGERPGLSSPESMGAYITFNPQPGLTDEARNCISNIHPQGLPYAAAAEKIFYLAHTALRLQLSGVHLKDNDTPRLG